MDSSNPIHNESDDSRQTQVDDEEKVSHPVPAEEVRALTGVKVSKKASPPDNQR